MSLKEEIEIARQEIVADGYEMSIGEIVNLYKDNEFIINPIFQRYFRWDLTRKTRFIESILLGIPTPPIFVYQNQDGIWELVDGLQRISTILQFMRLLRSDREEDKELILEGTRYLPSLEGISWPENGNSSNKFLDRNLQLQIKRARIRVEILKQESDQNAKFELFQRLNTGGIELSEQEVRNSITIKLNEELHGLMESMAELDTFVKSTQLSENQKDRALPEELVLRFLAYRNVPYEGRLDVHEYLDDALLRIASFEYSTLVDEANVFEETFSIIHKALGKKAFKSWVKGKASGKFSISAYEVISLGVSKNINRYKKSTDPAILEKKVQELWRNDVFTRNATSGVRGTTRLKNLLPIAGKLFKV